MHATAKNVTQDEPGFQRQCEGMGVAAFNSRTEAVFAGMNSMRVPDWAALRLEIHQTLQQLKPSGDGYWRRINSDLETKVAALEDSIQSFNPFSGDIRQRLGLRQRRTSDRSAEQAGANR
jgi:hypothetical protein